MTKNKPKNPAPHYQLACRLQEQYFFVSLLGWAPRKTHKKNPESETSDATTNLHKHTKAPQKTEQTQKVEECLSIGGRSNLVVGYLVNFIRF